MTTTNSKNGRYHQQGFFSIITEQNEFNYNFAYLFSLYSSLFFCLLSWTIILLWLSVQQFKQRKHALVLPTNFVLVATIFIEAGHKKATYGKIKGQMDQDCDIFFLSPICSSSRYKLKIFWSFKRIGQSISEILECWIHCFSVFITI